MAASDLIVNELLCFYSNFYKKSPASYIKVSILNCFLEDEITLSKETFHKHLSVHVNDLTRLIRRKGDNRGKLNVDDIEEYFNIADEKQVLSLLPTYVAVDLSKIPSVDSKVNQNSLVDNRISKLENVLDERCKNLEKLISDTNQNVLNLTKNVISVPNSSVGALTKSNVINSVHGQSKPEADATYTDTSSSDEELVAEQQVNSWATVAKKHRKNSKRNVVLSTDVTLSRSNQQFSKVGKSKLIGKATNINCGFAAGVKINPKTVFHVDNLGNDCDEKALQDYIGSCGIHVESIFVAKSWIHDKDSNSIKSFRVAVSTCDKAKMLNMDIWPDSVCVSLWKFKGPKESSTSQNGAV